MVILSQGMDFADWGHTRLIKCYLESTFYTGKGYTFHRGSFWGDENGILFAEYHAIQTNLGWDEAGMILDKLLKKSSSFSVEAPCPTWKWKKFRLFLRQQKKQHKLDVRPPWVSQSVDMGIDKASIGLNTCKLISAQWSGVLSHHCLSAACQPRQGHSKALHMPHG